MDFLLAEYPPLTLWVKLVGPLLEPTAEVDVIQRALILTHPCFLYGHKFSSHTICKELSPVVVHM